MLTKIQGQSFEITAPYAEGHTVSASEARVLNQVRSENIGNNMRKAVMEVLGEERYKAEEKLTDKEHAALQKEISEYDGKYDFSMTRIQGSVDPVVKEAKNIARELISKQLKANGTTLAEYKAQLGGYDAKAKEPDAKAVAKGRDLYAAKVEETAAKERVVAMAKENVKKTEEAAIKITL